MAGLRQTAAAPAVGMALVAISAFAMNPAHAQSFSWGGTGSTTGTTDYNLSTNWSNPPSGAPPVTSGHSAIFDTAGSSAVNVTAGPIAPDSWTFSATSQSYTISGSTVNFSLAGAGGGIINNANQTISIANNIAESVAGVQVQQLGNSTLVLSGTNAYTGGTLIGGGGTLQVTNNSAVGTGTVTLDNGNFQAGADNLTFSNSFQINNNLFSKAIDANGHALTVSGNITDGNGPGALTVVDSSGGGAVILTGTNTYSGGTTICFCGTMQLGDATHTGSLVGDVTNEGAFNIVNADTSGVTSITNDSGLTTFLNATSASSAVILNKNGGQTDFGVAAGTDNATAGHSAITNQFSGTTFFYAMTTAGNATITNRIGGATVFLDNSNGGSASLVNRFAGLTFFNDQSTAANANITNLDGGETLFAGNSSAGNATIANASSGGISGPPGGLDFFDASMAGTAAITNNNHGLILIGTPFGSDAPSADHATITNNTGGEIDFNAFATAGSAIITTNSGAATFFFDNSTGGNAQFITVGSGFVDFSGSLGPNGDGRITAGSIAGSGIYYIGAGNTLVVGSNNLSTSVSGLIADFNPCGCGSAGPGALEKVGTGTLTLAGPNSYTGMTTVNGGVLEVDGTIASSSLTTVNASAALTGTGIVGNTTIASGGILLPGNGTAASSITVAGSLAFQSGALYLVQLNSATSSLVNVTGTAALAGLVGASFTPGSTVLRQYTILTAAGGRSGVFDGAVVIAAPSALVATLSYDPTHAYLNFALDFGTSPCLNANQKSVATTLSNFFNANGSIPMAFAALGPVGLLQASGETATGSQQSTFDAMNLFLGLLSDPSIDGRSVVGGGAGPTAFAEPGDGASASAYAANRSNTMRDAFAKFPTKADAARNDLPDAHWRAWGAAYGGGASTTGNAVIGSNSATAGAFGVVGGADYRIAPDLLAGFALAGGGTNFAVNGFGSGRSDLFQAGAFMRRDIGAAYLTGALAYGWQDVTTDRTVTIAGIDRLHAEFNANAWSGRGEGGYRFATRWLGITPYAAGQFTLYQLPAYAEQVLAGAGTFALNYAAKDATASRSELGVRTDRSIALQNAILTLRGRVAWAHDYNTDRNITALFQTLPGASFIVNGAAQARDAALTTVSAETKWLNGLSLAASFEGGFSGISQSYAGKGVVRYVW